MPSGATGSWSVKVLPLAGARAFGEDLSAVLARDAS